MSPAKDPLGRLDASLNAEEEAVGRRFRAAERFTQGLPPVAASEETEAPGRAPAPVARSARSSGVVRTQFSFPVEDHQLIETLQTRGLRQGLRLTKSQIVRAGLRVLDAMTPGEFGEIVEQSKPMKPGRKPSS